MDDHFFGSIKGEDCVMTIMLEVVGAGMAILNGGSIDVDSLHQYAMALSSPHPFLIHLTLD